MSQLSKNPSLTTKKLFKHFLLLHDFLYKFTKLNAKNSAFFDVQMDVSDEMTRATKLGGKVGQASGFFSLLGYCLRSKKIARKLVFGFLYIYWTNHFFTLGSYFGALVKIPGLYKKVGEYYVTHNDSENYFERLNEFMDKDQQYQDNQKVLGTVFIDFQKKVKSQSLIVNDYFERNSEKYFSSPEFLLQKKQLKLPYFDSFLTRYVYYSFARWIGRVKLLFEKSHN